MASAEGIRSRGGLQTGVGGPGPTKRAGPFRAWISIPMPAPGERLHGGFAGRLVAVRGGAVAVLAVGERPHPRLARRRIGKHHDAANDLAVRYYIIALFTTATAALEH